LSRYVLFFFIMLVPAAMRADEFIPATGSGQFFCGIAAPRPDYGTEVDLSFYGSDNQGNVITANLSGGPLAGQPPCTPSFPSFSVSTAFGSYDRLSGPDGQLTYDGIEYTVGEGQGCSSSSLSDRCNVTFTANGESRNPRIDIAFTYWTLTFDSKGNVIGESNPTTVDVGGYLYITSLQYGQEPFSCCSAGAPITYVPFTRGTFTFAPEPAAWSLIACSVPLVLGYGRRKKSKNSLRALGKVGSA
jgi:hypothetical protein